MQQVEGARRTREAELEAERRDLLQQLADREAECEELERPRTRANEERDRIQREGLELERTLDCAGSCKIEGRGVALFRSMRGDDFTGIIGLPLIRLVELLHHFGVEWPPACQHNR